MSEQMLYRGALSRGVRQARDRNLRRELPLCRIKDGREPDGRHLLGRSEDPPVFDVSILDPYERVEGEHLRQRQAEPVVLLLVPVRRIA